LSNYKSILETLRQLNGVTKGDKSKTNVAVSVLRHKMQKALIIEAKRFPETKSKASLQQQKNGGMNLEQLEGYIVKARDQDKYPGTMYGMLVIGDRHNCYE
jgi:hypothetical protein